MEFRIGAGVFALTVFRLVLATLVFGASTDTVPADNSDRTARRTRKGEVEVQVQEIIKAAQGDVGLSELGKGVPGSWVESPAMTRNLSGGFKETIGKAMRVYADVSGRKVLENRMNVVIEGEGQSGRHVMLRARTYGGSELLKFHKTLDSEVLLKGEPSLVFKEDSESSKNARGDWESVIDRQYTVGSGTAAPASRFRVVMEPWLLSQTFRISLFRMGPSGGWSEIAEAGAERWEDCLAEIGKKAEKEPLTESRLLTRIVLTLWAGAFSEYTGSDSGAFAPFVASGGYRHLSETGTDQMLAKVRRVSQGFREKAETFLFPKEIRSRAAKSLLSERSALIRMGRQLGEFVEDFKKRQTMAEERRRIHLEIYGLIKERREGHPGEQEIMAKFTESLGRARLSLEQAAGLSPPSLPSVTQSFQDNSAWILKSYSRLASLGEAQDEEAYLEVLRLSLEARRSLREAGIALRALHIFEMCKEREILEYYKRELGSSSRSGPIGKHLQDMLEMIRRSIVEWEAEIG